MTVTAEIVQDVQAPDVSEIKEGGVGNEVIIAGPELTLDVNEKKLKAIRKEGGKKGIEIEGAADMGGLQFFCTCVELPEGKMDLLVESVKSMNAISDPTEEERKGGAGKIGKMILSCTDDVLAIVAYVPKHHLAACNATEWLKDVCCLSGAAMPEITNWAGVEAGAWAGAILQKDGNKGVFPLKMRDPAITNALAYLKKKGLFPDGNSDDEDEMVFGDDDFP